MKRKLDINEFPMIDDVSKIPTQLLKKLIIVYNDNIDKENEINILEKYRLAKEGKMKVHTSEEFFAILEKKGL